ncbi:hypothetical protein NIIDMKKI_68140 [Mycobacterium kansasii]|uniref:PA domain-containing protein n=1 Tax=Mycobacterium kansasii TaxID=1768 RepID=A0A7G1IS83_MYCKA|nr:hypothetical protein NIIDMKKI_68140 [Mycobacterium kansasii]
MVVVIALLVVGCVHSSGCPQAFTGNPAAAEFADALHNRVHTEAMMAHLAKLQDIANANNGTRAVGTPGYEASVDYVVNTLRNSGFDVQTPEFSARVFHAEKGSVTVGGLTVEAHALEYSLGTAPDGVSGPLLSVPTDDSPGCTAADYDKLPARGAVALVDRGSCEFAQKEDVAAQQGVAALIIVDNVDEQSMGGTLGSTPTSRSRSSVSPSRWACSCAGSPGRQPSNSLRAPRVSRRATSSRRRKPGPPPMW